MREDLVQNAVTFLQDPKVGSSALAKRIEFLESKSLTPEEIEEALKRSNHPPSAPAAGPSTAPTPSGQQHPGAATPQAYFAYAPPPPPRRDWRDWFVMATVTGGLGYGLYVLAQRYIIPRIAPPTSDALTADKQELQKQFDEAAALLDGIRSDTQELKDAEVARRSRVDEAVTEVEKSCEELRAMLVRRDEELARIKSDVQNIRELIPRALEKHGTTQTQSLADLQNELRSLKSLLVNRSKLALPPAPPAGPPDPPAAAAAPASLINTGSMPDAKLPIAQPSRPDSARSSPRPSIPAWQLANSNSDAEEEVKDGAQA